MITQKNQEIDSRIWVIFCNGSNCSVKRAGKVCEDSQDLKSLGYILRRDIICGLVQVLGDLVIVILNKGECNINNQMTTLMLNGWPRTIAKTIATATKL